MFLDEPTERLGKAKRHDARGSRNGKAAVFERPHIGDAPAEKIVCLTGIASISQKALTIIGKRKKGPMALEQANSPLALKARHRATHRGLRGAKLLCRTRDAT